MIGRNIIKEQKKSVSAVVNTLLPSTIFHLCPYQHNEAYDDLEANFRVRHVLHTEQVTFYVKDLLTLGTRVRTLMDT